MAEQTTYAVKIDADAKQELQSLLEGYKEGTGANAGDFMKVLIDTYKLNKLTNTVSTVDADIKELNTITARMYGIYSSMVQRIETNNNALQQQFAEGLSKKDINIDQLKEKLAEAEQKNEMISNAFNNTVEEKEELQQHNKQLEESNANYKEININLKEKVQQIEEYKNQNKELLKDLQELKSKYDNAINTVMEQKIQLEKAQADKEKASVEIESLKENHIKQVEDLREKASSEIADLKEKYNNQLEELKLKQEQELIQVNEKAEFNKEKALLELEREQQHKSKQQQDNFNININQYQQDYKKLLEELENFKKQPVKSTKTKKIEE